MLDKLLYNQGVDNMPKALHVGVTLVVAYIFFRYMLSFFTPFISGFVISMILEPVVKFLTKRGGFKRGLASFVSILIFTLSAVSIGKWITSSLYREAAKLLEAAPDYIAALQKLMSNYYFLPETQLLAWAGEWLSTRSIRVVGHVPGMLIGMLLILVSAFFFSRDRSIIFNLVAKWCPNWFEQYAKPVGERLRTASVGFLKSELVLFTMVATVTLIAMWMLGNPYALMMGLIIALFDSLPVVGAGLILWPWAGYLALTGQHPQAVGIMVLYGIITVIRNIIGPRILGDQIGMHPLAAIMSIFIGVKAFGAAGILAGPALVIVAQAMLDDIYSNCAKH